MKMVPKYYMTFTKINNDLLLVLFKNIKLDQMIVYGWIS